MLHICMRNCKFKYRNKLPFYILHCKLNFATHMLPYIWTQSHNTLMHTCQCRRTTCLNPPVFVLQSRLRGSRLNIIIVAEGATDRHGNPISSNAVKDVSIPSLFSPVCMCVCVCVHAFFPCRIVLIRNGLISS